MMCAFEFAAAGCQLSFAAVTCFQQADLEAILWVELIKTIGIVDWQLAGVNH